MHTFFLKFILESDATFGQGDGVAGVVDAEVQHDEYGFPYLAGRTLKGLLVRECAEVLAALPDNDRWKKAAQSLFGRPGSTLEDSALLTIGNAQLPDDLRKAIALDVQKNKFSAIDVLNSLTNLRQQTAVNDEGVPKTASLRTTRVILRGTPFEAKLSFTGKPTEDDLALLSACIKAFRRAGTNSNRGLGRLKAELLNENREVVTNTHFTRFRKEVLKCMP